MSRVPDTIITYKDDSDTKGKVEVVNKKKKVKKINILTKMTFEELKKIIFSKK